MGGTAERCCRFGKNRLAVFAFFFKGNKYNPVQSKRTENMCPHRGMSWNAYSSLIHRGRRLEITRESFNRWVGCHTVVRPHRGTLPGNKKE